MTDSNSPVFYYTPKIDSNSPVIRNFPSAERNLPVFSFSYQENKSPYDYYHTFSKEIKQANIPMDSFEAKSIFYFGLTKEYKAKVPGHTLCDPAKLIFYFTFLDDMENRHKADMSTLYL
jgi:hypothetical protein